MADLNETFGYQIFTGARNPSRDKVLQIAFAMALTLRETNRALMAAGASSLDPKCRRDAIIIFCIDQGCSLQKVNEELYRLGGGHGQLACLLVRTCWYDSCHGAK